MEHGHTLFQPYSNPIPRNRFHPSISFKNLGSDGNILSVGYQNGGKTFSKSKTKWQDEKVNKTPQQ